MGENRETVVAIIPAIEEKPTAAETKMSEEITKVEAQANAIAISSQADYESAATFAKYIKQRSAQVTDFFAPMKKAAYDAHANICAREKQMLAPLVAAEKTLKRTMGDYIMEQERKRKEEEERLKKLAQEEADRKLKEALALEAAGKKEEAADALLEADIVDNASRNVVVEPQKVKAEGVSNSIDWEITNIDGTKVPVEFNGICIRPVDDKTIIRLIRASKGQIKIPGITYKSVVKMTFRK